MTAYFLTEADREKLKRVIVAVLGDMGINPGSVRSFAEDFTTIHRASDAVLFKVTSNVAKRSGSTVASATCEAWTIDGWVTAGWSETVKNISDTMDIVASAGSPKYIPANIDRDGTWFFANLGEPGIIDIRLSGLALQYTKDGTTWTTWHTGEECT